MAKLKNKININETDYEVTATLADEAHKVTNKLEVTEHGPANNTKSWNFDGSEKRNLDIVPSKGGTFSGPITVTGSVDADKMTVKTAVNKEDTEVLNKSEIYNYVTELSGASWFTWNGIELTAVKTSEDKLQRIAIVEGLWADFETFKSYESKPAACLYLGKLEDTTASGYRLDFVKGTDSFAISNQLIRAIDSKVFTIEDILTQIDTKFNSLKSRLDSYEGTGKTIENKIDSIAIDVETLNSDLDNLEATVDIQGGNISKNTTAIENNTSEIDKIKDGTTLVGKAKDNLGRTTSTHYYGFPTVRLDNVLKPDTTKEHRIYIGSVEPREILGHIGDIWICYKE